MMQKSGGERLRFGAIGPINLLYDINPFFAEHTTTSIIVEGLLASASTNNNGHSLAPSTISCSLSLDAVISRRVFINLIFSSMCA